jgi:hypothetical protein
MEKENKMLLEEIIFLRDKQKRQSHINPNNSQNNSFAKENTIIDEDDNNVLSIKS